MCGIFCYVGKRNAAPILLEGLKDLEYRGYDSFGFAVINIDAVNANVRNIEIIKDKGKISELQNSDLEKLNGRIGICHTRWATHGIPNKINAHPHTDTTGKIAICHNGIIENYEELRTMLENEGVVFKSETDSEIIAHLVGKYYAGNLEQALLLAIKQLIGTYGIACVARDEDKVVCAKLGSPLIIGIGNKEFFVSSDSSAIMKHTKTVVYLDDGEMATVTPSGYTVYPENNKKKEYITWSIEHVQKGAFRHFMEKEIHEQPKTVENAIRGRVFDQGINISSLKDFQIPKRITIVACGTSFYAGLVGKYMIEKLTRIPVNVEIASEFRYNDPILEKDELVIAISQSGETADTKAAIEEAKRKGAKTFGIINVVGSSIAKMVDNGIYILAGPEIGVASTKAFTGQVVCLYMLTKKLEGKTATELWKIPKLIEEALKTEAQVEKIAENFKDKKNFLFLGRGINYPVAMEGALKLKEISYIHAEGYSAAEMKHGPIALIDENMPVVFIANNNNELYHKIISNMQEVKSRRGNIIVIANEGDTTIEKLADHVICVPKTPEDLSPIINIIPLQLLAYHIAVKKGLDPDKPRNLAKSVTVE